MTHDIATCISFRFLTEVDNLSYKFGIGEAERQRVDEAGHVQMTNVETQRLSQTKTFCGILIFGGIMVSLVGRVIFGALVISAVVAGACKASELISMDASAREKLQLLGICVGCQAAAGSFIMGLAILSVDSRG